MALRVTQPFGSYAVGDTITDAAEIASVATSDQATFVVAVADAPAAAPARAPTSPPPVTPAPAAPEASKE